MMMYVFILQSHLSSLILNLSHVSQLADISALKPGCVSIKKVRGEQYESDSEPAKKKVAKDSSKSSENRRKRSKRRLSDDEEDDENNDDEDDDEEYQDNDSVSVKQERSVHTQHSLKSK